MTCHCGLKAPHVCLPPRPLRVGTALPPIRGNFARQMREHPSPWPKEKR